MWSARWSTLEDDIRQYKHFSSKVHIARFSKSLLQTIICYLRQIELYLLKRNFSFTTYLKILRFSNVNSNNLKNFLFLVWCFRFLLDIMFQIPSWYDVSGFFLIWCFRFLLDMMLQISSIYWCYMIYIKSKMIIMYFIQTIKIHYMTK
jgi:hypothetical protein